MALLLPGLLPGSAGRPDLSDQKCLRRLGNPAEVALQTLTSLRSQDIPTTSPDIGSDPGDDVVLLDVSRDSGRHRSNRDDSVALEDDNFCDHSSADRHTEVPYSCADTLDDLKRVVRLLPHLVDYHTLSERLLAVKQANTSLHATMERLAPLEMEVVALRDQNQLLDQLLGGRGSVGSAPAPTLPRSLAPGPGRA
ncbi:uncharacterized protein PHALS_01209 [Plasmopara halstedii]|uniref:Uncharacterized protein n=1 Tax=Plasmopara halstedii TaxID=4781 RepID=A0A0P1AW64_PLAHL|nr:uncharacterized protein PHALS_01209 [Plasmopara halstedii]CEG44879.1 hypothetical protein PHALS_01209 [Plasmopara halstedii]|eukprot:XP_024581248.1 hypothetical protein PHALS_01209 [Plasmopara halstedii]